MKMNPIQIKQRKNKNFNSEHSNLSFFMGKDPSRTKWKFGPNILKQHIRSWSEPERKEFILFLY